MASSVTTVRFPLPFPWVRPMGLLLFTSLLLTSCQLLQKESFTPLESPVQQGQWWTHMRIVDHREDRSYVVKMTVKAYDRKKMRLDITHTFKGHLASLVLKGDHIEYLLVPTKRFYSAPLSRRSLKPLIPIPLHPELLYNLFFRRPMTQKGWMCRRDKERLSQCWNKHLTVHWMDDEKRRHEKILVDHQWGQLHIDISRFSPKVLEKKAVFTLKKPKSFLFEGL